MLVNQTTDRPAALPITPRVPEPSGVQEWLQSQQIHPALQRERSYSSDGNPLPRTENPWGYDRSPTSSAAPGDSPFYNRVFWASYKGLSRGLLGGLLLGAALGAAVGGLVAGGLALAVGGVTATVASVVVGGAAMIGMKYYKDVFSLVGANTGAIAAAMEINEERNQVVNQKLDKLLELEVRRARLDPQELEDLHKDARLARHRGLQYFEDKLQSGSPVFWGLAAVGAAVGAVFGGILLWAGYDVFTDMLKHAGLASETASLGATAMGGALVSATALGGATFGINRHYFRQHFNVTNALYEGDLRYVGKAREQEKQSAIEACEQQALPGDAPCELSTSAASRPGTRIAEPHMQGQVRQGVLATQAAL